MGEMYVKKKANNVYNYIEEKIININIGIIRPQAYK